MASVLAIAVAVFTTVAIAYAWLGSLPLRRLRGLETDQTLTTVLPEDAVREVIEGAMRPQRRRRCFETGQGYECRYRYRRSRGLFEVLLRIDVTGERGRTRVRVWVAHLGFPRMTRPVIDGAFGGEAPVLRRRIVAHLLAQDPAALVSSRRIAWNRAAALTRAER